MLNSVSPDFNVATRKITISHMVHIMLLLDRAERDRSVTMASSI